MSPVRPVAVVLVVLIGPLLMVPGQAAIGSPDTGTRVPVREPLWKIDSDQVVATFGESVGSAGDVNGDGFDDVIVGAPNYHDNGLTDEGWAFVYHGSASGLSLTPAWMAEGDKLFASFGQSVGSAGDVNADGFDDVIVGAPGFKNGQGDEGAAFVYLGSASGLSPTPAWKDESDKVSAAFGKSVGTAGDVNGDGFDDVIVGASSYDNDRYNEGGAFAYLGSASGLSTTPSWIAEGDQTDAHFGGSVGTAGDVNRDGFDDVIVGASEYDNGQFQEGQAFVYQGSASGLSTTPAWAADGDQDYAFLGGSVGTAGDVNGDGFDDVIVGATEYDNGQVNEGRALGYHGSASGLSLAPSWMAEGDQESADFGDSVASAGDVNGDGFDEVIVGASEYDNGQAYEGRAFAYLGSASGLSLNATWTVESNKDYAYFGDSVGTAGDVNGEGFDEVIVGAWGYSHGEYAEGAAFVYGKRSKL